MVTSHNHPTPPNYTKTKSCRTVLKHSTLVLGGGSKWNHTTVVAHNPSKKMKEKKKKKNTEHLVLCTWCSDKTKHFPLSTLCSNQKLNILLTPLRFYSPNFLSISSLASSPLGKEKDSMEVCETLDLCNFRDADLFGDVPVCECDR